MIWVTVILQKAILYNIFTKFYKSHHLNKWFICIGYLRNNNNMELRKNLAISDNGFMLDASTGESYSLNPVGLEILNYLKEGLSDEEIKSKILEKYDVTAAGFDLVYFDFIRTLQHLSLLTES